VKARAAFNRRLRILAISLGIALLLWLPIEDTSERWVLGFGICISGLAAARLLNSRFVPPNPVWWIYALAGLLSGLAVTPIALLLMAFKGGVHGHGRPDFTPGQVTIVLQLSPVWVAAGVLIGLGVALWVQARKDIKVY
jgi:hypothetical protein